MATPSIEDLQVTQFSIDSDGVAWLRLNRPHAGNSRNQRMRDELAAIYESVRASDEIRVLVLTGVGERFFCTGMDLRETVHRESRQARASRLRASRDIDTLAALPVPTIAAVNGFALGGGLEMALACDMRIVAEHALLGLPELVHGLVPGGGGTQRLPRVVGPALTLEMLYLARRLTGADAVRLGLANEVVPLSELEDRAAELARVVAEHPPRAVRAAKELVRASAEVSLDVGLRHELEALIALLDARDDHHGESTPDRAAEAGTRRTP